MYKQRIILFFSIVLSSYALLFILTSIFSITYPLYIPNAAYWLKEGFSIKEHRAKTIDTQKIFLVSGSNTLFSICTPLLEEKTNQKIVNFGLNAYTPIEIYFAEIKKYAKPGDIVIMPLEYNFYTNEKILEDWVIRILLTWGSEFIKEFSVKQILEILFKSLPYLPERMINHDIKFPGRSYEEYMQSLNSKNPLAILRRADGGNAYNSFGDKIIDNESKLKLDFSNRYFYLTDLKDFRFQQLKDFADFLAKQNIKLLLTYPVTIQNPEFDLTQKEHADRLQKLTDKIKEHGLDIIGIPKLSNFELIFSYDSIYHLNAEGAMLRTLYLADTINCYLANKTQEIPDMEEYKKQRKAEAKKMLEKYRKLGYYPE